VKILLLEDDSNLGFILQEHLELEKYSVTLCTNGDEGVKAFRSCPYDLCLVDVMMPKKDGFAFARDVRKTDQQTPLIFLTAKSLKEDRIEGFKIGCDDYITKPFSMEELMLRIHAVLKRAKPAAGTEMPTGSFSIGKYSFDHERQIEPLSDVGQNRHAKLALAVRDHEVHDFRRHLFGRTDEIAFILAVLGIHNDDDPPGGNGLDRGFDTGKTMGHDFFTYFINAKLLKLHHFSL